MTPDPDRKADPAPSEQEPPVAGELSQEGAFDDIGWNSFGGEDFSGEGDDGAAEPIVLAFKPLAAVAPEDLDDVEEAGPVVEAGYVPAEPVAEVPAVEEAEPVAGPVAEVDDEPVAEVPAVEEAEPVAEPVAEIDDEPAVEEPVAEPVAEVPVAEPVAEVPAVEAVEEAEAEPVAEAGPVAEPVAAVEPAAVSEPANLDETWDEVSVPLDPEPEPVAVVEPVAEPEPGPAGAHKAPVEPDRRPAEDEPKPLLAVVDPASAPTAAPGPRQPLPETEPAADTGQAPAAAGAGAAVATPATPRPSERSQTPAEPVRPPAKDSDDTPRRRSLFIRLVVAAIILLLLVWGGAAVATMLHVFGDSSVSGVKVGGMSPDEARTAVTKGVGAQLKKPVTMTAAGSNAQVVPASSGVSVDAEASVDRLTGFTLNPVTIIDRLTGAQVEAVTKVDAKALTGALNDQIEILSTGTQNANIIISGTTPILTAGVNGSGLDVKASVAKLSAHWPLGKQTIVLVEGKTEPVVTDDEAQELIDEVLTPLLSGNLTVSAAGTPAAATAQGDVVLTPEMIARMTVITIKGGEISASLNPTKLHEAVVGAMGAGIETAPEDSGFTIEQSADAQPVYKPGKNGVGVDTTALSASLIEASTGNRTVSVPLVPVGPEHNETAEELAVTGLISEASTPYPEIPNRTHNLQLGAQRINGTLVRPGEEFNLLELLGPLNEANGYLPAGVVDGNGHSNAAGGGLSQIATTSFAAGFKGGMDDVEHQTHSNWFSRYPAGMEATVWTDEASGTTVNMRWANSTPYAVLVHAWLSDGKVHVQLWSTTYYSVNVTQGARSDFQPVTTKDKSGQPGCTPYAGGQGGFTITVTRTRTKPDGTQMPENRLTTTYVPDNAVICTPQGGAGQ